MDPNLERYIDQTKGQGTPDKEGEFTVNFAAAREKLARYRLPDPRFYILKLIQWAVAGKATWVDITINRNMVKVEHNGLPVRSEDISKLGEVMIGGKENPCLSHLLIGVQTAGGLGAKDIRLVSSEGLSCRFTDDGLEVERTETEVLHQSLELNSIPPAVCSRNTASKFLGLVSHAEPDAPSYFSKDLFSLRRAEIALVRLHCAFASIPIKLNGEVVNRPFFGFGAKVQARSESSISMRPASLTTDVGGDKIYLVAPKLEDQLIPAPTFNWVGAARWWQLRDHNDLEGELLGQASPSKARLILHRYFLSRYSGSESILPQLESHKARMKHFRLNGQPMVGCFAILVRGLGTPGISVVHDGVVVADIPHLRIFAVVSSLGLDLDLSGFNLISGPALQKMIKRLEHWCAKKS
jgi:hypothetical protein